MAERDQLNRWRCLVVGCNPVMKSEDSKNAHVEKTGHRTAKWPVRSAEGKRRAEQRNKSGYYEKYNVGAKFRGSGSMRARESVASVELTGCSGASWGSAIYVGGSFAGFDEDEYCGECSWCEENEIDHDYAFGEDDF